MIRWNIAICDDEKSALDILSGAIVSAFKNYDVDAVVETFARPAALLERMKSCTFDLLFLDIEMPGLGGLALAKALKDIDPDTHIVFVTSYEQYAVDAFSVRATGYLLKPAHLEDVRRELAFIGNNQRRHDAHVGGEGVSAAGSGSAGQGSWHAKGAHGRRVGGESCNRSSSFARFACGHSEVSKPRWTVCRFCSSARSPKSCLRFWWIDADAA